MHIDYLTLACLKDELQFLIDARVQRVVRVDELSIGFELYAGQRYDLLFSANNQRPRVLLSPEKLRRGVQNDHPLMMQLRKRVRGARLSAITQPQWERILRFTFSGPEGECSLIAELMGRYSNLILVDENGKVLEAIKRVNAQMNRFREILPAHPYQVPPTPPNRWAPDEADYETILRNNAGEPLNKALSGSLLATSPTLAREIEARAQKVADENLQVDPSPESVKWLTMELFEDAARGKWTPSLGYDEDQRLVAFAPYPLTQCAESRPAESINAAMLAYLEHGEPIDAYANARAQAAAYLKDARGRLEQRVRRLEEQQIDEADIAHLRENGELLLTYQHQIRRGMTEITLTDYEGNPRKIDLDPTLNPSDNAQRYFKRYNKAQRAYEGVPARLEQERADLAFLEQLDADLAIASSRPQIDAVLNTLIEAGWVKTTARPKAPDGGPLRVEVDSWLIFVGRSAQQNEQITFKLANPDDLWLHIHDLPGSHVIIRSSGQPVPETVLQYAAQLAAHYSPLRKQGGRAQVDFTQRKHVRHIPGGHPGMVTYTNSETILVQDARKDPRKR
ncbi:MAG: NFACT family protein [Anaerolineaceae bacterium]|nr:NFACT family protein [Anaerolineaceae bacterium]